MDHEIAGLKRMRAQRGGALVESLICMCVAIAFFFGIIQFGVIMFTVNALNQVARETARYAAVHGLESTSDDQASDPVSIRAELQNLCASDGLNFGSVLNTSSSAGTQLVTPNAYASRSEGTVVTVTVQYDMSHIEFFNPFGMTNYFATGQSGATRTVTSSTVIDVGSTQTPP